MDELETHIRDMYDELVREFHEKKAMDREMSNKDLKIEGLTREAVKLRASVREKERVISSIQADLERHVKTTEIKDLEGALKDMYRTYVKHERPGTRNRGSVSVSSVAEGGGKDGEGGVSALNPVQASEAVQGDMRVDVACRYADLLLSLLFAEVLRQKQYMERHAKGLKRKLATRQMQQKAASRARLAENSSLINECNTLRKDNITFRRRIKELETTVYLLTRDNGGPPPSGTESASNGRMDTMGTRHFQSSTSSAGLNQMSSTSQPQMEASRRSGASAATAPQRTRSRQRRSGDPGNDAVMNMMRRSRSEAPRSSRSAAGRSGSRGGRGQTHGPRPLTSSSSTGRIVRGTTKQMDELSSVRVKMSELLGQLDDNNREMAMQRREIKRLRDQVRILATQQQRPPMPPPAGLPGARLPPTSPLSSPRDAAPGTLAPVHPPGRHAEPRKGRAPVGVPSQGGGHVDGVLGSSVPHTSQDARPRDNMDGAHGGALRSQGPSMG